MHPDDIRNYSSARNRWHCSYDRDTTPNAPGEADPKGTHPLQIKAQEKRARKAAKRAKEI
jgi:hypothetical protein